MKTMPQTLTPNSAELARRLRYQIATREPFVPGESADIQVSTLWGAKGVTAQNFTCWVFVPKPCPAPNARSILARNRIISRKNGGFSTCPLPARNQRWYCLALKASYILPPLDLVSGLMQEDKASLHLSNVPVLREITPLNFSSPNRRPLGRMLLRVGESGEFRGHRASLSYVLPAARCATGSGRASIRRSVPGTPYLTAWLRFVASSRPVMRYVKDVF